MRAVVFLLLVAGSCIAQVQSAADVGAGSATSVLAQGSLAVINYTPAANPPSFATVSLLPADSTTPSPAQVVSVGFLTITFVVPTGVPVGDAQLIYKPGSQASQWIRVSIVPSNLSLFRSGLIGPLQAQNINPDGTPVLNGLATPAQPGQPVVLWGTGLGATPQSAVKVTLGGVTQTVLYAGAAPGQPGLDQINFRIAAGTPDGCYVALTVAYGTQTVTSFLSKTSDGLPCHHPFELSVDAMKLLDSGGTIETGEIGLSTGIQAPSSDRASRQESAQVPPLLFNAPNIARYFIDAATSPPQPCSIVSSSGGIGILGPGFAPGVLGSITLKSATSTLTLPATIPQPADSPLNNLPPPVIAAGKWTWGTSGGSNLAASSFDFVLSPPIQIAGSAPLTLDRTQSQTIKWDGSGYDSGATVRLALTSQYFPSPTLTCSVAAQAGAVTLPSNLLAKFNAGSAGALSVTVSETGSGMPHAQFNLLDGNPLLMIVNWSSSDARPVDFQ